MEIRDANFYITLTSIGSRTYYPSNNSASFKTHLHSPLLFGESYEVALVELQLNKTWHNLREDINTQVELDFGAGEKLRFSLEDSVGFNEPKEFIEVANDIFTKEASRYPNYTPSFSLTQDGKLGITVKRRTVLRLSRQLAHALGFTQHRFGRTDSIEPKTFYGRYLPHLDFTAHSVYIHTSIIDPSFVRDDFLKVLRIVQLNENYGRWISKTFERPFYHPLCTREFQNIDLELKDSGGNLLRFDIPSETVVVLHFRPQPIFGH